jgi:hypothetical protein
MYSGMLNRPSLRRSMPPLLTAATLIATALGPMAPSSAAARTNAPSARIAAAGRDLLANAGAEVGDASKNGWDAVTVPGWHVLKGLPSVVGYGTPRFPSKTAPGPKRRGDHLFIGGAGGTSVLAQEIPVRFPIGHPRPARVSFTASAWLGASGLLTNEASLQVWFLGRHGATLGHVVVGPVTETDRHGTTELLKRAASGILPSATTAIRVKLVLATRAKNFDGPWAPKHGFNRAEADDVSLRLSAPIRRPPQLRPPRPKVPHYDHVFMFYMENQDYASIIGNKARAPFINSLLPKSSLLSNVGATAHQPARGEPELQAQREEHRGHHRRCAQDVEGLSPGRQRALRQHRA